MSTLLLVSLFIVTIAWPSRLISRLVPPTGHTRLGFHVLGPLIAVTGGWCVSYLLFPLLAASPSSAKENESFLVNQATIGLLSAAVLPWIVYFVLKAWRGKNRE